MRKITKINFYEVANKYAIITYDDGSSLKVSKQTGIYAIKRFVKENNIESYEDLAKTNTIKVYKENSAKLLEEVSNETIIKKSMKTNNYVNTEVEEINFTVDENDEVYASILYKFNLNNKFKKTEYIQEDVTLKEGINILIDYAKERSITDLDSLCKENNVISIDRRINRYFYEKLLPQIEKTNNIKKNKGVAKNMDIKNIDYIKEGNKYFVEVKYSDGNTKILNLKEARLLIENIKKDEDYFDKYKLSDLVNFYVKENGNYSQITKEEYQNIKPEPVKKDVQKNTNITNIGKIVLYKFIDENNNERVNAIIYYTNGSVKNVSKEEANKIALEYANNNNIQNLEDLFDSKIIEAVSGKTLEKNFANYRKEAMQNTSDDLDKVNDEIGKDVQGIIEAEENKLKNLWNKVKKTLKENKLVRRIAICAGAIILGTVGFKIAHHNTKSGMINNTNIEDDTNTETTTKDASTRDDFSKYTYNELLEKCQNNKARKGAMTTLNSFLTNYNKTVANKYIESGKEAKIVHTIDETTAMYLTYNNIDSETIYDIYGAKSFDTDTLKDNLENAMYQDSLAHNIQDAPLGKDILIQDETAKNLYNKYEEIFININKASNSTDKASYIQQFYDNVREDLPGMANSDYSGVDSYKIIIKEFNDSIKNITLDTKNELTEQENNYIDGILNNVVEEKLADLVIKQNARSIDAAIDYGDGSDILNDNNPYYSDFEEQLTKELVAENAYYTTDENRDISSYDSFIKNTKLVNNIELGSSTDTNTKTNIANNNPTIIAGINNTVEQPTTIEDNDSSLQDATKANEEAINKNNEEVDALMQQNAEEAKAANEELQKQKEEEINRLKEEENRKHEEELRKQQEDFERQQQEAEDKRQQDENENSGIDEFNPDDITEVIDETENPVDESQINIDKDKTDASGNLNDQYTDLTTNPYNTINANKTNEQLADEIISQMSSVENSYDEEISLSR